MERELQSVQVVGLGQACVDYVGFVPAYPVEDSKMELEGLFISCGGPAATARILGPRKPGIGSCEPKVINMIMFAHTLNDHLSYPDVG